MDDLLCLNGYTASFILESDALFRARHFSAEQFCPGENFHASFAKSVCECFGHVGVRAFQELLAALDDRHVASESGVVGGKLHRCRTAAEDDERLRDMCAFQHIVGRPITDLFKRGQGWLTNH